MQEREGMPTGLRWFLWASALLTAASAVATAWFCARGGLQYGLHWIFPAEAFFDLGDYRQHMPYLHSQQFFTIGDYPWYYPAPAIFVLEPFYALERFHVRHLGFAAYLLAALAGSAYAARMFYRRLVEAGLTARAARWFLGVVGLTAYPVYFALQRGNIEALLWLLLAAGCWSCARKRWLMAAVLFGLAGSVKLYPLLFLALMIRPRKYKEMVAGAAVFAASTVAGMWVLEPDVVDSAKRVAAGIHEWTVDYAQTLGFDAAAADHSIFQGIKQITQGLHPNYAREMNVYLVVAGVVAMFCFLLRGLKMPMVNQVLFLTCGMVMLPPASFDYTLNALYIPLAWLAVAEVQSWRMGREIAGMRWVMALLAVAMGWDVFLVVGGQLYAGLGRMVAMVGLMGLALWRPLGAEREDSVMGMVVG